MSSYSADLAAIFVGPFEKTEEETEVQENLSSQESPKKEEPKEPLMTSTPHVKSQSATESTTSLQEPMNPFLMSTPHIESQLATAATSFQDTQETSASREDYQSIEDEPNADISHTITVVDEIAVSPRSGSSSPPKTPSLNVVVNPLNAMANSIAEAFKKRSPTTAHASFVLSTGSGCRTETSLKYTPLTFDDDEQLPICSGGAGSANLNANNNNSASVPTEEPANTGGRTRYGATANQGGSDGGGGGGTFADRVSFRSPLSVFVICSVILVVFLGIIGLSAIGKAAKKRHHAPNHGVALPVKHGAHPRMHEDMRNHHAGAVGGAEAVGGAGHGAAVVDGTGHHTIIHHVDHHSDPPIAVHEKTPQHETLKQHSKATIDELKTRFLTGKDKIESAWKKKRHIPYDMLINEMTRLSNSTDYLFLKSWQKDLKKQLQIVERKIKKLSKMPENVDDFLYQLAHLGNHEERKKSEDQFQIREKNIKKHADLIKHPDKVNHNGPGDQLPMHENPDADQQLHSLDFPLNPINPPINEINPPIDQNNHPINKIDHQTNLLNPPRNVKRSFTNRTF